MDQRFLRFLVLAVLIIIGGNLVNSWLFPRPPQARAPKAEKPVAPADAADKKVVIDKPSQPPLPEKGQPDANQTPPDGAEPAVPSEKPELPPEPPQPERLLSLGSLDPSSPYRMLVTLTTRGAAVARIELNGRRYYEQENRAGYLGYVADARTRGEGCRIRMVGPGSPAAVAGLRGELWTKQGDQWQHEPGDLVVAVDGERVLGPETFEEALRTRSPGRTVVLTVRRGDEELSIPVVLARHPLQMVQPEGNDPLSLLLTLRRIGDRQLKMPADKALLAGDELEGVDLWTSNWEVEKTEPHEVVFRRLLRAEQIEVRKAYRIKPLPEDKIHDPFAPGYHLTLSVEIRNVGSTGRELAYQLDGPTGLPHEGAWYASKVSPASGLAGLRDVLISLGGHNEMIHASAIASGKVPAPFQDFGTQPVVFAGVDTQYFAAMLIPRVAKPGENWFELAHALRVGPVPADDPRLTNVSCRLVSLPQKIEPGQSLRHEYDLFVGPKRPELLAQYGLSSVVYYGWPIFAFFAVPLVKVLHALYWLVPNYGLAIILLTVLVRLCMFPISHKQAVNAQKMQMLAPEIKKIAEKYKKDLEARTRAQRELFQKHNYNPWGGCLLLFIQLPIFIGLYRALMIDVDLRGATLFGDQIRWCFNLAAPDMFYNWSRFMPDWVNKGQGLFGLGPYLNLLPIATVAIFNWQQKKLMPPPTDEQQAMQQKVMQWMMIFMGVLFYKVPSGLCIYFMASSLWSIAERQFLPKPTAQPVGPQTRADAKAQAKSDGSRNGNSLKSRDAR